MVHYSLLARRLLISLINTRSTMISHSSLGDINLLEVKSAASVACIFVILIANRYLRSHRAEFSHECLTI